MRDLHVSKQLPECCRLNLKKIDKALATLAAEGKKPDFSLHEMLGTKPVHQAIPAIPEASSDSFGAPSALRRKVQDTCVGICSDHVKTHRGITASFWNKLAGGEQSTNPKQYAFMFFGWADLILMENSPKILPRSPILEKLPQAEPPAPKPISPKVNPSSPGESGSGAGKNPNKNPKDSWDQFQKYKDLIDGRKA